MRYPTITTHKLEYVLNKLTSIYKMVILSADLPYIHTKDSDGRRYELFVKFSEGVFTVDQVEFDMPFVE